MKKRLLHFLILLLTLASFAGETLDPEFIYIIARRGDIVTSDTTRVGWRDGMFTWLEPSMWDDSALSVSDFTLRRCFIAQYKKSESANIKEKSKSGKGVGNLNLPTCGYIDYSSLGKIEDIYGVKWEGIDTLVHMDTILPIFNFQTEPTSALKDGKLKDWKNTEAIIDWNAVSSGSYTVGSGGGDDYPTWGGAGGALPDVVDLTGSLTLTGETSTTEVTKIRIEKDPNSFKLIIDGNSGHNGDPTSGLLTTVTHSTYFFETAFIKSTGSGGLYMRDFNIITASGGASSPMIRLYQTLGNDCFYEFKDMLMNCNGENAEAFNIQGASTGSVYHLLNCNCWSASGRCMYLLNIAGTVVVENCNIRSGIKGFDIAGTNSGILLQNCTASDFSSYDYGGHAAANITGNHNSSEDATAADGNWNSGSGNISSITTTDCVLSTDDTNSLFFDIKESGPWDGTGITNTLTRTTCIRGRAVPNAAADTTSMGIAEIPPPAGPSITSVTPDTGSQNGGTSLTIAGTQFLTEGASSYLIIDTDTISTDTWNDTAITASTIAHAIGLVDVIVATASDPPDTSADAYTFLAHPSLTSITPDSGTDTGGTSVTVLGTGFLAAQGAGTLYFDLDEAASYTKWVDDTIIGVTPAATRGYKGLIITNASSLADTLLAAFFMQEQCIVDSISPTSGETAGETSVTVYGSGFLASQTTGAVTIGDSGVASYDSWKDDTVVVTTTAYPDSAALTLTLTNSDNSAETATYTYNLTTPSLTSIAADSGTRAGGETVTITGTGFLPAQGSGTVVFGDSSVSFYASWTNTKIVLTTPRTSDEGATDYIITNADAEADTGSYNFLNYPVIDSISPASFSQAGGDTITIYGWAFVDTQGSSGTVLIDTGNAASYESWADDEVEFVTSPFPIFGVTWLHLTNDDSFKDSLQFLLSDSTVKKGNPRSKKQFGWMSTWMQFSRRLIRTLR